VVHDLFLNKEHIGNGVRQKSQGILVEKEQKSESDRERSRLDWQQKVWAGKRKPTQGGVSNVQVSVWAKSHTHKHSSQYTYTHSKTIEERECNNNNGQNCVLPILMTFFLELYKLCCLICILIIYHHLWLITNISQCTVPAHLAQSYVTRPSASDLYVSI